MKWSADLDARLGELVDTAQTGSQIGRHMGLTRNAVISRANRLGWHVGTPRTPDQRQPPFLTSVSIRQVTAPEDRPVSFSVKFDRETFGTITDLAVADGVSRSQKIRELIEWGLEA